MTTGTKQGMYEGILDRLSAEPKTWLVTGVAGFIGSNLLESLLDLGQWVVGLDNFATGHRRNLEDVGRAVGQAAWRRFRFVEGDITDPKICQAACEEVDFVLHQAALASVPRSIQDPLATHHANVTGFLNMLMAARDRRVTRFVYATSSSVYGSHAALPKIENRIGTPLSPYAATKYVDELYAKVFAALYGVRCIGLRYFNVFGPRQDPAGPYAAVIPRWVDLLLRKQPCPIYGDGESSRDFCYVADVVQANLLAAVTQKAAAVNQVYNIAFGRRITLNELHDTIRDKMARICPGLTGLQPRYLPARPGDIRHSWAGIGKAARLLEFAPTHSVEQGLDLTLPWYVRHATLASTRPDIPPADPRFRPGHTGELSPIPRPV
ncbi:MAG TPA: SDR family oxidoreductase [Candidatus Methylomirabilis sp.]|nr:SDR family oxidoreductase [Candidatus Methylomirabilis sp.]